MDANGAEKEVLSTLIELVEACREDEIGFRTAAKVVKDLHVKTVFGHYSLQRTLFINQLQVEIERYGGRPQAVEGTSGKMHEGWHNLKTALSAGDEAAIVAECERGEDTVVDLYRRARGRKLPPHILGLIQRQYDEIIATHDRIRSFRDTYNLSH